MHFQHQVNMMWFFILIRFFFLFRILVNHNGLFSAGVLSREAARYTENFVFTVGVGDDLVMRLSVDSAENLRTKIMQTIHATKLPKVNVILY